MKEQKGPRNEYFWTYCWGGLVIGEAVGAWMSWGLFKSPWACAALATGIALIFAYITGKAEDPFWPCQNM